MRDAKEIRAKIREDLDKRLEETPKIRESFLALTNLQQAHQEQTDLMVDMLKSALRKSGEAQEITMSSADLDKIIDYFRSDSIVKKASEGYYARAAEALLAIAKLGGMYYALGHEREEILDVIRDPYWMGLTDKQQIDPPDPDEEEGRD